MHPLSHFEGTGRFEIVKQLGEGGMGVVYLAHDRERNTRVALKVLRTMSADAVLRFKNEFRALQDIQHGNLVSLGELVEERGAWFFTMELVDGVSFLEYVRPLTRLGQITTSFSFDGPTGPDGRAENGPLADRLPSAEFDERRLRRALLQVTDGLMVLHAAGKVHRDIKPTNILITQDGRAVILDFGLVAQVSTEEPVSELRVVGTTAYMAPEQAVSRVARPASDFYSLGVLLYEAMTGTLPFVGAPLEVLMRKQTDVPVAPSALVAGLPPALDTLCMELLSIDQAQRPDGLAIIARLEDGLVDDGVARKKARALTAIPSPTDISTFVGRSAELDVLRDSLSDVARRQAVTVVVRGESGVGKSALVQQFLHKLGQDPALVVLRGRCFERETVLYKAVDGVVDSLARYMSQLSVSDAASLLPLKVGLLSDVFPVLRRVEIVAQAPWESARDVEPQVLRRVVFGALREMLTRLAQRRRLVIVIDDLQWADPDGLALLAEVLRPPDTPPLLLLATMRTNSQDDGWHHVVGAFPGDVRHIQLKGLPYDDAVQFVENLRASQGTSAPFDVDAIIKGADGHPLFIEELVRHIAATGESPFGQKRFEDALWSRISELGSEPRRILELVATAGGPTQQRVIFSAAMFEASAYAKHLAVLRSSRLVKTSGVRTSDVIEAYHDRIRDAVYDYMAPDQRGELHRRLAVAMEGAQSRDGETLARHWRAAGENQKAAHYLLLAGQEAMEAVAFDRAVHLLKDVLEIDPPKGAQACVLHSTLGRAYAGIGKGKEAASEWLKAADRATPDEVRELTLKAGDQLLRSGHLDQGLAVLNQSLHAVGLRLAPTPRQAAFSLLLRRAHLRLRGLSTKERFPSEIPTELLHRIDVTWAVAVGLSAVDPIRGAELQVKNLLLCLEAGDAYRLARALAVESTYQTTQGPKSYARADRLMEMASELAGRIENPHATGIIQLFRGITAFQRSNFSGARSRLQEAHQTFATRCTGVAWEIATANLFCVLSECMRGEALRMREVIPQLQREAEDRGDLYTLTNMRTGLANMIHLFDDKPDDARRDASLALRGWSHDGFYLQHMFDILANVQIDLYEGQGETAYRRVLTNWPMLEDALLHRVAFLRTSSLFLRARAAICAAAETSGGHRKSLLSAARSDCRALSSSPIPYARAGALLALAGAAEIEGHLDEAVARWSSAEELLARLEMRLFRHSAMLRRGVAMGDAGKAVRAKAEAWFESNNIKAPHRLARVFAPGVLR